MPVPPELARDPAVAGPLGSLALSVVRPRASTLALRALRWHRDLARLGVNVPLAVVHDFGLLLACPREQLELGARTNVASLLSSGTTTAAGAEARADGAGIGEAEALVRAYANVVRQVSESQAAQRSSGLRMSDDVLVVLLARLLGSVAQRCRIRPSYPAGVPLDAALFERIDEQLPALFLAATRTHDLASLRELVQAELYVLTVVDALDLDTLELFGMLGGDAAQGAAVQVDLLSALGTAETHDVVNFSLEILPSVLEAKARPGSSSHAAYGYAGLARKGSIDSLVLSELTWDEEELMRRLADDELLYYAREQAQDEALRVHHVLIDASASMRGERATFARGMAIAAAKKLLLAREDVTFRFFDARLYEPHAARSGQLPIAYLLSFKGERGRNPTRVFGELASVLELLAQRDARQPIVHVFTHGGLYIPRDAVTAVNRFAKISAVFTLPSGGAVDLDYLDLLDAYWVVDHQTLASRGARAREARRILGDVGVAAAEAPLSARRPPARTGSSG